ncbi:hypothetical protein EDB81DRAFT_869797 [Dactylonectria macrodidyma]|uniref:DUF7888 domain-containing protein n=1 Tax=Dactylonectria macrodidyma TaxID=307937 RepID=A0A9P9J3F4_9HYPO|nr:hypothetical protein EDB81DRAFT_869797 [Dactylonectria macrodidyma]
MRFITAAIYCTAILGGPANSTPVPAAGDVNPSIPASQQNTLTGRKGDDGTFIIEPEPVASTKLVRRAVPVVVVGIVGTAAASIVAKIAIEIGAETIKNLGEWNEAREAFTKKTTQEMWDRNPDYTRFPAAACYNKGYRLADPAKIDGLVSAKFELGLLNTDYDCMFIEGPNQFFTDSEGGYINLSYTYNPDRCSFDDRTGDLTCS